MTRTELTQNYLARFETAKRPDGSEFLRIREGAECEALSDLIRDIAHDGGSVLPSDILYAEFIRAMEWVAELRDDDDVYDLSIDIEPDPYTHDVRAWFMDCLRSADWIDAARAEYNAIPRDADIDTLLSWGQQHMRQTFARALAEALAEDA